MSEKRNPAPVTNLVVKPLEWKETEEGTGRYASAKTLIGGYDVFHLPITVRGEHRDMFGWSGHWMNADQKSGSFEEAKDAAQADYERRVLSCLTQPPETKLRGDDNADA